ncbi:MAG TPA: peptidoglycan-binding domain-containing protein [Caldimonas sp.]|nr:peptidoglycan-binding domain-containing protein [Caldimonas sp.]
MARVMQMTVATELDTDINQIYMIDSGVGPGRANRRDDVMLVQLLLKKAGANSVTPDGLPLQHHSNLKVDGIFGPMTARFIEGFESTGALTRRLGHMHVVSDGGFDPLPASGAVKASASGLWYKIFAVNVLAKQNHEESYDHLVSDPPTPPLLRATLQNRGSFRRA